MPEIKTCLAHLLELLHAYAFPFYQATPGIVFMRRMREDQNSHLLSYKISASQVMAIMFPPFLRNRLPLPLTWMMHHQLAESRNKDLKIKLD